LDLKLPFSLWLPAWPAKTSHLTSDHTLVPLVIDLARKLPEDQGCVFIFVAMEFTKPGSNQCWQSAYQQEYLMEYYFLLTVSV
jgi:hypothetical protein